jgi:hypothetical protein
MSNKRLKMELAYDRGRCRRKAAGHGKSPDKSPPKGKEA